jgi:hypothetical protein
MEPGALVASGCCHRGPARGAVDCGQPDNHLPDNRLPDRSQPDNHLPDQSHLRIHIVGRLPADEFSSRLGSKFRARVDGSRILRAVVWDRSLVTAGDLV